MDKLLPVVFVGHGNPMNAVTANPFREGWSKLGRSIPKPKAVLSISAHWYIHGTAVTAMPKPRTLHDFGGFPEELYEIAYPAPGSTELAARVQDMLAPRTVSMDKSWGLDHGTWTVLMHMLPEADVPVVQLSMDASQPPQYHYETGRMLSALRREGVLIFGSGNLVHNLYTYAWEEPDILAYEWATRFQDRARELISKGQDRHRELIDYERLGKDAELSIPTPEHYLPLLYVLGASLEGEAVSFPVEGFDGGSVSMLAVKVG